ncbi:MAG: right-handed parallel beta-helix repeat-containing protein [Nitrospirae bacterium]|nr:right-handed parallel beta-helix repeat-containing protein [Nitrospirota bacterium]
MRISPVLYLVLWFLCTLAPSVYAADCTTTVALDESIQTAIDSSSSGSTICIEQGTYYEQITLKEGITVKGLETARTVIDGSGSGTVVTGAKSASIVNITITDGSTGISLTNITGFTIKNVVVNGNSTGINCDASSGTIENSVINGNSTTAISLSNQPTITISNTILSDNETDITTGASSDMDGLTLETNLLYNNTTSNYPSSDTTSITGDPKFVDTSSNDFHLQSGSPAIDSGTGSDPDGTTADIGVYGGSDMDQTIFRIGSITVEKVDTTSMNVTWSTNAAYNITGYKIYFDYDGSGESYNGTSAEGASPIDVGNVTSITLTNLSGYAIVAPDGLSVGFGDRRLYISWNAVSGASGYYLYYGTSSGSYGTPIDVGNQTSHTLENLTNNTTYYIAVSAYFTSTYYASVSAYDNYGHESELLNEAIAELSSKAEGPKSGEKSDYPEESSFFPHLKDTNMCFIATAAYGSGMEPEVMLLRKFRDRFLLTNTVGRVFVSGYYTLSPPIASFIRDHEAIKPVIRCALIPFIWTAKIYLGTSSGWMITILLLILLSSAYLGLYRWKRRKTN